MNGVNELVIRRPDDWHVHLRDGELLTAVLPYTSEVNARAMVMPNLVPPLTTIEAACAYRKRILTASKHVFQPLIACYLIDSLPKRVLREGFEKKIFSAAKLYPAHATTNSQHGVTNIAQVSPIFDLLQEIGMPLLIHGEMTDPNIDIFDREAYFIDNVLIPLRKNWPELKVVLEHITTKEAVQYIKESDHHIGATITPQHLMFNRNQMLVGGIHPHLYCLPILKRYSHQQALRQAIASGDTHFFAGSDSAPHLRHNKESDCGCAGIFNAPCSLSAYATVFEEMNALPLLEAFCSENGARFYGLPFNKGKVHLIKQDWTVAPEIPVGNESIVPFLAGERLPWKIQLDANPTSAILR